MNARTSHRYEPWRVARVRRTRGEDGNVAIAAVFTIFAAMAAMGIVALVMSTMSSVGSATRTAVVDSAMIVAYSDALTNLRTGAGSTADAAVGSADASATVTGDVVSLTGSHGLLTGDIAQEVPVYSSTANYVGGWDEHGQALWVDETTTAPASFDSVQSSGDRTCGLDENGEAWCWGTNANGQLGDGTTSRMPEPVRIAETATGETLTFTSLIRGTSQTMCGFEDDGAPADGSPLWCWGFSSHGQLGTGTIDTTSYTTVPVQPDGGHQFVTASQSSTTTCATKVNGDLLCWGENTGVWSNEEERVTLQTTPVKVTMTDDEGVLVDPNFKRVSLDRNTACALTDEGVVWCWSVENLLGAIGRPIAGVTEAAYSPSSVAGGGIVAAARVVIVPVSTPDPDPETPSVVVPPDLDEDGKYATIDVAPEETGTVKSLVCAIEDDGTPADGGPAWCWGAGTKGQLGNGANVDEVFPVPVSGGHLFTELVLTSDTVCGLKADGSVLCWGDDSKGQLGDGGGVSAGSNVPVPVDGAVKYDSLVASTGFERTFCGVTTGGDVRCWGQNDSKQIPGQAVTAVAAPVPVGVSAVGATLGDEFACTVASDGLTTCWGQNTTGQTGRGSVTVAEDPAPVAERPDHRPGFVGFLTGAKL